jgi:hypothetical protein
MGERGGDGKEGRNRDKDSGLGTERREEVAFSF